jgi:hypothetical protein
VTPPACLPHQPQEAGASRPDDPDNVRSSWFSNPGASATGAALRAGVGKYIAGPALDGGGGSSTKAPAAAVAAGNGAAAAAAAEPAAKRQKVAAQQQQKQKQAGGGSMNFDSW